MDGHPEKGMLLCFLVNHVETATETSAGVLLLTSLASFQPQEAGELCEFDESMGNAMFVSHQWVTGRKFSHNAGNQFILWCACASFFLHWHTVLSCRITIYEPLTYKFYKSLSITGPINLVTSGFFLMDPMDPWAAFTPRSPAIILTPSWSNWLCCNAPWRTSSMGNAKCHWDLLWNSPLVDWNVQVHRTSKWINSMCGILAEHRWDWRWEGLGEGMGEIGNYCI